MKPGGKHGAKNNMRNDETRIAGKAARSAQEWDTAPIDETRKIKSLKVRYIPEDGKVTEKEEETFVLDFPRAFTSKDGKLCFTGKTAQRVDEKTGQKKWLCVRHDRFAAYKVTYA